MFPQSSEGREFFKGLSKQLVEQIAPEELEIFDELYEETLENSGQPAASGSDDALGFGITGLMVAATPVVTTVVGAVIPFLATEVIKAAQNESATLIQRKVKALFSSKKKDGPVQLTPEQLERVKKLAIKRARAMGMKEEKANQLALALVGSLAI
jgi:hypothetical protein